MSESISSDHLQVVNNRDKSRFEIRVQGKLAIAEYIDRGQRIVFTHTEVPRGFEGMGIGTKLVTAALNFAREEGKTVIPLCPYVAAFIRRHREYQDLVLQGFKF